MTGFSKGASTTTSHVHPVKAYQDPGNERKEHFGSVRANTLLCFCSGIIGVHPR